MTAPTWFLRAGRKRRGRIVKILGQEPVTGCIKVDAGWPYTQPVWVTPAEIAAATKEVQPNLKLK